MHALIKFQGPEVSTIPDLECLTLSDWQNKTNTCAKSVDQDETVHNGSTLFAILFLIVD